MCSLVLLHGIRTNVLQHGQWLLTELEGHSTKYSSTHFPTSVITLGGELAGDLDQANNMVLLWEKLKSWSLP